MNKQRLKAIRRWMRVPETATILLLATLGVISVRLMVDVKDYGEDQHPVVPVPTKQVAVFFNNSVLDPDYLCYPVFPVYRTVPAGGDVAVATLQALLAGPTEAEQSQGYFSSINIGTQIQSLRVDESTALVDFDKQLGFEVGGSCRVGAIRSQIVETVKAVTGALDVVISIDGNSQEILEP